MIAVVTKAGRQGLTRYFVEYEIREDGGAVLAFDYVTITAQGGETPVQTLRLVQDYIAGRVAKWAVTPVDGRSRRKETAIGKRMPIENMTVVVAPFQRAYTVAEAFSAVYRWAARPLTEDEMAAVRDHLAGGRRAEAAAIFALARQDMAWRSVMGEV